MATFRFLHCADLHLDSPLRGLEADPDAPVDKIRGATRDALQNLVNFAIEQHVDFVVAAGDLYDGDWQDWRTGRFLLDQIRRLTDENIPFIAIRGNHDAASVITNNLRMPGEAARLLDHRRPETFRLPDLQVAIHGQSFATRAVTDNIARTYPPPVPGWFNVGVLHSSVGARPLHDNYAPCSVDELRSHDYDYWALGHIHQRRVLAERPWIVFPGNLQGRHARETGPKGACLVTFEDRVPTVERLTFDLARWERCRVDVSGASTFDDCLMRCREDLIGAIGTGADTYAIRVEFHGSTAANGVLRSQSEHLVNEVRAIALALGGPDTWIEQVIVATTPPTGRLSLEGDGVAGEIGRVLAELQSEVSSLTASDGAKLPALSNLRSQLRATGAPDMGDALNDAAISAALEDAAELLATLLGGEGQDRAD